MIVLESEWSACTDPLAMLDWLVRNGRASDRKLRLFAAACTRRIWHLLDDLGRNAVQMAEAYADRLATADEMRAFRQMCKAFGQPTTSWYATISNPAIAARNAALSAQSAASACAERQAQVTLLHDIFGESAATVTASTNWLTTEVMALASNIYEERTFERMGELGDALRHARCDDERVLEHCHQTGGHVRGCWAVDLLVGRG